MAENATNVSDPLQVRAQARIFTVADYVADEPGGKLYVSVGGLEWLGAAAFQNRLSLLLAPFDRAQLVRLSAQRRYYAARH